MARKTATRRPTARATAVLAAVALLLLFVTSMVVSDLKVQDAGAAATVPGRPTNVSAQPGRTSATIRWKAPAQTGGSAITAYVITPYRGGGKQPPKTFPASPLVQTFSGLKFAKSYTFTVVAVNRVGTGASSAASPPILTGIPTAPGSPTALPGNSTATVKWTIPAQNGGAGITGYVISPFLNGVAQRARRFFSSAPLRMQTLTGLANGRVYTFKVAAMNPFGTGRQSAATGAIVVGAPIPPASVSADPRSAAARVSWTAAPSNGAPVTAYVVTPYLAGVAQSPRPFASTATSETVTGLPNGKSYTFKVAGKNSRGTGVSSNASVPITIGTPSAPTNLSSGGEVDCGTIAVSWTAPNDNGSDIDSYNVIVDSVNHWFHTDSTVQFVSVGNGPNGSDGRAYVRVVAHNKYGSGIPSTAASFFFYGCS